MKLFFKIMLVIFGVPIALIFVYGLGVKIQDIREWNKLKNNPFIHEIGKWGRHGFKTEIVLDNDYFNIGMPREDWISVLDKHGFKIDKSVNDCGWSSMRGLSFLEKYDSCAVMSVKTDLGFSGCSYIYIVAAKFEDNKLQKAIGTNNHFICL